MTRIIGALSEIGAGYDALFCDLWGCVHNGISPYPAAIAALQEYRRGGGKVCLMTNAPRPQQFIAAQIDEMGVPRDSWDVIVSSGDTAQDAMLAGAVGRKVWHIGTDKDDGFFDDIPAEWADAAPIVRVPLEEAEGMVVTGPFDELNEVPDDYRARLMQAQKRGLKFLCANPDIVVDKGEVRIYCAGALAELYTDLGGESLYFGKPHAPIYDMARRKLNLGPKAQILAIGDGIRTDILGAVQEDIDSLFITGGLAADAMGADIENPDEVLMTEWLAVHALSPTYAMGRLR